jgi:membrane fusion protein (multidrug efflux system)
MTASDSTMRWRLAGGLALCVLAAACQRAGDGPTRGNGRGDKPVPVVIESVRQQPWQDELRALGTVAAHESVTVTAKVSETVEQVHFESGQAVARGAPLVTLSGRQQEAALAAAEATATEAEHQFQRQSQLAAQQLVARSALDAQRATRDAARAQVAQIRANLADRVIRAPFAGVLGIRQVSPGALVTPGTAIATLDDVQRVYVDFPVPETELAGVAPGQAVSGTTGTWPGRRFDGTVEVVSARLDAGSRAAMIRAGFANPDRALRPGMLVDVRLTRDERPALVVPEIAVQQVGTETFVWRVGADGKVAKADVVVGGRIPGKAMLRSGVRAGDRIVTDGVGKLREGDKVEAAPAAGAASAATPAG